jgi:hypothetical protein
VLGGFTEGIQGDAGTGFHGEPFLGQPLKRRKG